MKQIGLLLCGRLILLITCMITDRIGLHSVLLIIATFLESNNRLQESKIREESELPNIIVTHLRSLHCLRAQVSKNASKCKSYKKILHTVHTNALRFCPYSLSNITGSLSVGADSSKFLTALACRRRGILHEVAEPQCDWWTRTLHHWEQKTDLAETYHVILLGNKFIVMDTNILIHSSMGYAARNQN